VKSSVVRLRTQCHRMATIKQQQRNGVFCTSCRGVITTSVQLSESVSEEFGGELVS
jgi:hypothetical protein